MSKTTRKERIIPIKIEGAEEETVKPAPQSKEAKNVSKLPSISPNKSEEKMKSSAMDVESDQDSDGTTDGCVEELTRHIREVLKKSSLPAYNTPERIILAIDSCQDYNASPFALENKTADALTMLKLVISNLVRTKLSIDILRRHEFAVVVLNENSVDWVLDFTNNADKVIKAIGKITSKEGEDVFPLASLFEVILEKIQLQEITEAGGVIIPPQEVQRLILFYNRSYTLPELKTSDKITALLKSDYFFFDALMTHEPMDTDNHAEKISNLLQNIPYKKRGYFFSVERNAKTLLESAIQFVGHPLQRPPQENADYTLRVKLDHE